jgi:hypothetical protein
MPDQTPRHCVYLKPSSSVAAELDRDAFRTDPHDMCPRWFGCGWIWRPEREQRVQSVEGNEIDAAQVDSQYAAVPHQPSGVRAHVVYVGRVDLAAYGDHGEFGIVADPNTGSAAIDDRAVLTSRMVDVIVPSNHVQAFAGLAQVGECRARKGYLETQTLTEARRKKAVTPTLHCESTLHLLNALSPLRHAPSLLRQCTLSTPFVSAGFVHARLPHLASVFAAMAVSHHVEHQTGWGIKRFVATTRRYRTEKFGACRQILAAADPLPDDLCNDELAKIGHATVLEFIWTVPGSRLWIA